MKRVLLTILLLLGYAGIVESQMLVSRRIVAAAGGQVGNIATGGHTHYQATVNGTQFTSPAITTSVSGSTFAMSVECLNGIYATVSDAKGNTYTAVDSVDEGSGQVKGYTFYKENGTGGASHTFTVNLSVSGRTNFYCVEVTGGLTSGILDKHSGLDDASSPFTSSLTGTTTQPVELILGFVITRTPSGTETITWNAVYPFTQIDADGNANYMTGGSAQRKVTSVDSYQTSITSNVATRAISFIMTFISQ